MNDELKIVLDKLYPILDELSELIKWWTFELINWQFKVTFNKPKSKL